MSLSQALNQFAQNLGRYQPWTDLRLRFFSLHGIPSTGGFNWYARPANQL